MLKKSLSFLSEVDSLIAHTHTSASQEPNRCVYAVGNIVYIEWVCVCEREREWEWVCVFYIIFFLRSLRTFHLCLVDIAFADLWYFNSSWKEILPIFYVHLCICSVVSVCVCQICFVFWDSRESLCKEKHYYHYKYLWMPLVWIITTRSLWTRFIIIKLWHFFGAPTFYKFVH